MVALVADHVLELDHQAFLTQFVGLPGALGGTWFPLETNGGAFAAIGRWMQSTWAMNGLQNMLIRRLPLNSARLPVAVLMVYAAGFFGLAVWRLRPN